MWRYETMVAYMKNQHLGSFFEKMFWQQIKLSYDTFCSLQLIKVVGWSLVWKKYIDEIFKHLCWN
jgi:hypothetical protein